MEVVFSEASLLVRVRGGSRLKTSQVKKVSLKYIFVKIVHEILKIMLQYYYENVKIVFVAKEITHGGVISIMYWA